jgi:hypothetical protein
MHHAHVSHLKDLAPIQAFVIIVGLFLVLTIYFYPTITPSGKIVPIKFLLSSSTSSSDLRLSVGSLPCFSPASNLSRLWSSIPLRHRPANILIFLQVIFSDRENTSC